MVLFVLRISSLVLLVAASAAARSVTLSVGPAPDRNVRRWWDVSPRPANDGMELIKANSHVAKSLPRPWTSRCEKTALLTSTIAVVRLLGGWKDDEGSEKKDLAQGACDGLTNASLLYERLDAVVDACLTPIVVLDNVPWCFSNTTKKSFYGNGDAPRDMKSYSEFLDEIFEAILARYGDEAKRWYYRVGTEPNYGGHWTAGFDAASGERWRDPPTISQLRFDAYAEVYDAVVAGVREKLGGGARVGPGNMPNGMNATFAKLVVEHTAATDGQVMALSYYASGANGYSTESAHRAMAWLKNERDAAFGNLSTPPALHAAEFGTLQPPRSSEASPEPGAFGAAFTASAWIVGLMLSYDKLYHWTAWDDVDDDTLLYGWTVGMAFAELLFEDGAADARPATFLDSSMPMELKDAKASRNATSVAGVATTTSAGLSVLVTAYDPTVYVGDEAIDATLVVPAIGAVSSYYCLHSGNSVYDKIWADLNATGGLARTDGHTYKLKHMANDQGMEMIKANVSSYVALQDESLKTNPFPGTVSRLNATHAALTWKVRVPSVTLIQIS